MLLLTRLYKVDWYYLLQKEVTFGQKNFYFYKLRTLESAKVCRWIACFYSNIRKEHKFCYDALNTAGNLSAEKLKKSDSYAFLRDIFESYHYTMFTDMVKEGNFAKSYLMNCIKESSIAP